MLYSTMNPDSETLSDHDESLGLEVEHYIQTLLPKQRCSLEQVALLLNMHPRTLQRRLANDGISFHDLVDTIRRRQAEQLLKQIDLTIGQIALELGYRRVSSFGRAHLRWFGLSPVKHQRLLQE